jgi:predicted RNA binding protein YcfA (HicA-like mRNA interferase family)
MASFGPIKRRKLIHNLRQAGFFGPFPGGSHEFMRKGDLRVILPNPHISDISKGLLAEILREAELSREQWEEL